MSHSRVDPDAGETCKADRRYPAAHLPRWRRGVLSTASDYMRFALMLANGGEGYGVRLLSRKTIELMASDQLGSALSQGPNFFGSRLRVRVDGGSADPAWHGRLSR